MISASEALRRLQEGNRRFVSGVGSRRAGVTITQADRAKLAEGQEPFAAVIGCSDSRVPPEIIFDQGLGDLFVIRVAGNIAGPSQIGSVEFAVSNLGVQLVVVLGHSSCGAVIAALEALAEPEGARSEARSQAWSGARSDAWSGARSEAWSGARSEGQSQSQARSEAQSQSRSEAWSGARSEARSQSEGQPQSPNLGSILDCIRSSLKALGAREALDSPEVEGRYDSLVRQAVRANVEASIRTLREKSQVIEKFILEKKLQVVGAEYSLETGIVEFFSEKEGSTV
jgi:carbonic anhydrase